MVSELDNLDGKVQDYDVIMINEAQFFVGLRENVIRWCDVLKKVVIVSGLDGNFMREKFGEQIDLVPHCDKVKKLTAFCSMCNNGNKAIYTWKLEDNQTTNIEVGTDKYIALCRQHYNSFNTTLHNTYFYNSDNSDNNSDDNSKNTTNNSYSDSDSDISI